jgi:hypothetical protein
MVFAISNALQYREKVEEDLADLAEDISNSSRAINAVTSTYHLHEWLWAHSLKPNKPIAFPNAPISTKRDFVRCLEMNCPYFNLIQELTNGSKHALPVTNGSKIEGYGSGPFGVGPFGRSYLLIDLGPAARSGRYLVASEIIAQAGQFMIALAKSFGA